MPPGGTDLFGKFLDVGNPNKALPAATQMGLDVQQAGKTRESLKEGKNVALGDKRESAGRSGGFVWLSPLSRRDWGRLEEGQGEVGSLLQEAGDVIPAARGPHERVGLHGDVSSHQLGRLLPPRAAAVADAVVVHSKPGNRGGTERGEVSRGLTPTPQDFGSCVFHAFVTLQFFGV